ncbi:uncharacterized protein JCM6883_006667 [Sporobolomyces salmoneus]|uniref:uncharacterized protein n=1 Tax=Sporobolomyces salmoneus TaxID=183962 RepID=UPI00317FD733
MTSFPDLNSTLQLPPSAIPELLSSLAVPSRYSLRHPTTLTRIYVALNSFALTPATRDPTLFDLPPDPLRLSSPNDPSSAPIPLSVIQSSTSSSSPTSSSALPSRGRPICGHVFKPGESVYRCRTCGLDPTCVLCSTCFHASPEHRQLGHDVTVSVHSGVGAGCCDCGDEEAWKEGRQRDCKLHGVNAKMTMGTGMGSGKGKEKQTDEEREREESKEEVKRDVKELVRAVFEWSLEQFEKSPRDVIAPKSIRDFAKLSGGGGGSSVPTTQPMEGREEEEEEQATPTSWQHLVGAPRLQSASIPTLSNPWVTTPSTNSTDSLPEQEQLSRGPFAVILWNDEKHSFPQVIEIVSRSIGCSRSASSQVAQRVDTVGRDVILITPTAEEALRVSKTINSIDLGIDVRDAKQVFEECVAGEVIKWMKDLMKVRVGGEENALSQVVAEVWTERQSEGDESRFMRLARVEERLWKEVRKNVQEICVGLMSVSPEIKAQLSTQYATIYPHLCNSYLLTDREPENSLIFLSVQIFTVPSICSTLVSPPYDFLSTLLDILFAFFTEQTDPPRPPPLPSPLDDDEASRLLAASRPKPRRLILPPNPTVRWIDPESGPSFKQKRYFQLFSDLNHLISSPSVQQLIVSTPSLLEKLASFLSLFEGMNPVVRAVGTHVEYESDSWVSAFNVTIQLGKLCRSFGTAYRTKANGMELAKGLSSLIAKMSNEVTTNGSVKSSHAIKLGGGGTGNAYNSIEFNVAKEKNSFHHPLTWLWAEMAKNVELLDKGELSKLGLEGGLSELAGGQKGRMFFLAVMEQPLRVIVLVAQVRAGLWVRNGFGVRAQQLHYKEYSLRENTYDQDLFFLQNALVILDPSQVFASIMDRFDLKSWLIEGKDQHEVFEPIQAMAMTEELLSLLISLLSDPTYTKPLSDSEALERELVHYLALGPCVYSDLLRRISERFGDDPSMDQILARIANFKPPTGTNDQGSYSLRDKFYDAVDPYFSRFTRNQREEVDKIVCDHFKKRSSTPSTSEPVIVPTPLRIEKGPFVDLARSFTSPVLFQLIFFSLKHGRSRGELFSEVVVDQALHLSMMALSHPTSQEAFVEFARRDAPVEPDLGGESTREDEEREADEYVPKSAVEEDESTFVRLLVKIEEDERMKAVKHKASWLLDRLEETLGGEVGQWRNRSMVSQEEELKRKTEEKRLAAKKRQEAIMQQFAKAQSAFLESVEDEEDEDDEYEDAGYGNEDDDEIRMGEDEETPPKPRVDFGTCIVCQDELEESKPFGILGLVQGSNLIRLTPTGDDNLAFQQEILSTPTSLDQDASSLRPFGIASEKVRVHSFDESGDGIARGFPQSQKSGFHASSCGHLMHLTCFKTYCGSLSARHRQQPTRCHPETIERQEFVCPLCKSLGNVLLPAAPDAPSFLPYSGPFDSRSLTEWSDASPNFILTANPSNIQIVDLLAQANELQLVNDLDQSVLFKPWKISLALPTILQSRFGDGEGLMIARLLQVITALKSEIGSPNGGGPITITQDLLGYTLASMEVASRGSSEPAWKIGDANLKLVQSIFSTMQHIIEVTSPSPEVTAVAIRQRLGGYFARGTRFENAEFTRFDPLGSVIEAAACTPSMFYQVVAVSFYNFLAQSYLGVFRFFHQSSNFAEWKGEHDSDEARLYSSLVGIRNSVSSPALFNPGTPSFDLTLGKHLYSQALPFLRRVSIVARVAFGEPSNTSGGQGTELERLFELLRIPHPSSVLRMNDFSVSDDPTVNFIRAHLTECYLSATYLQGFDVVSTVDRFINSSVPDLEHPTIYELLGLPHHLDTLITSALERQCTRCDQTPENPAICLFCGELVCCQSFCCMAGEEEAQHGECNEHMWTCGGSIGIYFLVKRNVLLFLHTDKGTFTHPPYLDSHGEVDNGRTRSRSVFPQFLHQGRYDEVRKAWLNQGVPTLVARKLEATTDHGGWSTM